MKKIVFFVIVLFLLIISAPCVMAQTPSTTPVPVVDPFKVSKEPTALIHEEYDLVNSVIPLDRTDTTIAQHSLIGVTKTWVENWFGYVKPLDNNYHITTYLSIPYAEQVQNASSQDLTPAQQQDITVHDAQPKPYCVTGRLCVTDPTTGELALNAVADTVWCTHGNVPGLLHQTEGTRRLSSFTTRYVQPSQDFTVADIRVKRELPPTCSERSSGDIIDQTDFPSVDENLYGENGDAISTIVYTITEQTVSTIQKVIDGVTQTITQYTSKFTAPAINVMGGLLPWAGHNNCLLSGCPNPADLDPVKYLNPAQKQELQRDGGWVNSMYRNDQMDPNYKVGRDATFEDQDFDVSLGSKQAKANTTVYAIRRTQEAQTFGNCSILNEGDPMWTRLGCGKKRWVIKTPSNIAASPPSPENSRGSKTSGTTPIKPDSVPSTAPAAYSGAIAGMVPACVLSAVATIEGAFEGGTSCKPDACGAVGPFQISIGKCTSACHASSCPNELPKNMSPSDMCNWDTAANQAASVLIGKANYYGYDLTNADPTTQRDAIIIAGDSYNGTTNTISRLTSSTGQPLTYGEWVYAHCDPTYTTHIDHSFPPAGSGVQF